MYLIVYNFQLVSVNIVSQPAFFSIWIDFTHSVSLQMHAFDRVDQVMSNNIKHSFMFCVFGNMLYFKMSILLYIIYLTSAKGHLDWGNGLSILNFN